MKRNKKRLFASGYGDGINADILLLEADGEGNLQIISGVCAKDAPSFLTYHRQSETLYSVSELPVAAKITAWKMCGERFVREKELEVPGTGLCHLCQGERGLWGSCYGSGTFFAVDYALTRVLWQFESKGGHAHWIESGFSDGILLAADLGKDLLWKFREDMTAANLPESRRLPKGSGPRQILRCAEEDVCAVICEQSGEIIMFSGETPDAQNEIYRGRTTRLPEENYPGGACAGRGGIIFTANRGADTIAVFDVGRAKSGARIDARRADTDASDVSVQEAFQGEWPCGGCWPRFLASDGGGFVYAACQKSGNVVSLRHDGGMLCVRDRISLEGASCIIVKDGGG